MLSKETVELVSAIDELVSAIDADRKNIRQALADLVAAAEPIAKYLGAGDIKDMTVKTGLLGAGYLPNKPISIADVEEFAAAVERAKALL